MDPRGLEKSSSGWGPSLLLRRTHRAERPQKTVPSMVTSTTTISLRRPPFDLTWFIYSAKRMPGVVFSGLETRLTKVKVITASAFESWSVDGEHLTAITPTFQTAVELLRRSVRLLNFIPKKTMLPKQTLRHGNKNSRDPGVNARHQLHLRQQPGPVRLLREVHDDIFAVGTER